MTTSRPRTPRQKALTTAELEMMNILWRIGPCSIAQMLEELPQGRALAYTSVSTIVRILEQKGFVRSEKAGRGHLYSAAVPKDDYQARSLKLLMNNVFDGAPSLVVRRLLDTHKLSKEEIEQIRAMLRKQGDK